jgi:hypothetical protein
MDWIWPCLGFSLVAALIVVSIVLSSRRRPDKPGWGGRSGRGAGPDTML